MGSNSSVKTIPSDHSSKRHRFVNATFVKIAECRNDRRSNAFHLSAFHFGQLCLKMEIQRENRNA